MNWLKILQMLKSRYGLIGILYLLFPRDLISDFRLPIGLLDDLIFFIIVYWQYKRWLESQSHKTQTTGSSRSSVAGNGGPNVEFDPWAVLELPKGASLDQIDKQYRKLAAQYHPDKVNHLGKDLQKTAHEKMIAIQKAYEALARAAKD